MLDLLKKPLVKLGVPAGGAVVSGLVLGLMHPLTLGLGAAVVLLHLFVK